MNRVQIISDKNKRSLKIKSLIQKKINHSKVKKSNIIVLGVPHTSYKNIKIPKNKYLIDSWGFFER